MTLYFAYGSNLNLDQMQRRCPAATPLDKLYLQGWQLVFRMVADVTPSDDHSAPGGLWQLTPECERELDRYEGFNPLHPDSGMYRKVRVAVDGLPDGETHVMMYVMNSTGIMPPSTGYYDCIRDGYRDFGLKQTALRLALKHSHDAKHPTHVERKRMRRKGRPALKARPVRKVVSDAPKPVKAGIGAGEANRWADVRARAQEADRASAALKRKPSAADVARRSRLNGLSAWLEEQKCSGNRY
jgi:hypothetical protein